MKLTKFTIPILFTVMVLFSCKENKEQNSNNITVKLGFVMPLSGALASIGESSEELVSSVEKAMNEKQIKVDGKTAVFEIFIEDGQSNPSKATEVTNKLIAQNKVDIVLVGGAPPTVNPVAAVCEARKIPCISATSPLDSWLQGGPYEYSYHFFWNTDGVIDLYGNMWKQLDTNKQVGGMWANDTEGIGWAKSFMAQLPAKGYKVYDLGRFPMGTTDYTSFIQNLKKENIEILTGNMAPPDFAAFWRQCQQLGYRPKIVTMAKALLFPAAVESLGGDLAEGLSCEVWWSPFNPYSSSLTGESASDLANSFDGQWSQTTGFSHATFEVAFDAIKRAGTLDKKSLLKAIAETNLNTVVGNIHYNNQHYSLTPLLGGQWTKGTTYPWEIDIVENSAIPKVEKAGSLKIISYK